MSTKFPAALRGALLVLAPLLLLAAPTSAGEGQGPSETARGTSLVTLAEVASQVQPGATRLTNLTDLLRRDVEAAIAAIDWSKERVRRRYILSASLVRLETSVEDRTLRVSCTVSAAVRDDRGNLLAIVEGRALAEDTSSAAQSAEQGALSGAARGAIKAVPEAIRQAE